MADRSNTVRWVIGNAARILPAAASALLACWTWRLVAGFTHLEAEFQTVMPASQWWRYMVSPFLPLTVASLSLLALALGPMRTTVQHRLAMTALLACVAAAFVPAGFAHDLGHCVLEGCSERLGYTHLIACAEAGGFAVFWMLLILSLGPKRAKTTQSCPATTPLRMIGKGETVM